MKIFLTFISVFVLSIMTAQNQTKNNSILDSLKVKTNHSKTISADTLDSFMIKKKQKTEITLAKNYLGPKSDSYFDIAVYIIKKQFQDSPIISWILTAMLAFWIIRMIKKIIEIITNRK